MSNEFLPEITLKAKMEAFPDSDDDSKLVAKVYDPNLSHLRWTNNTSFILCYTHSICYIMHIDPFLAKELPRANEYCIDRNKRKPHETSKINFQYPHKC